jgi:ADP-ribosylglycohydrolase
MQHLPDDYFERVYAGALGKALGVYLGRPVEGWTYEQIVEQLGDIEYYVNERVGVPLVVTDDDIAGTFTFVRALADHGNDISITPQQIGEAWLNYIVEGRTILWWGGLGNSTEHTAYLRLKAGIPAPRSGSIELNGKVVAEQIGAQIFIDGWAMVAPGQPALAAELARRAASVSHDGEAVFAAQALAAMEAQAFVERDVDALLDMGLTVIPRDSTVATMIRTVRGWHAREPDWRVARQLLVDNYGYDRYGGDCHVIPNHGLIVLALLYGEAEWDRSMSIVNTCGWDTDCNSGNLGCLLGIRNGLAGFESERDWRAPVGDRMYLSTADGGRAITDVATEALHIVNIGRAVAGEVPLRPKAGARFHFELPGSLQGFQVSVGNAGITSVEGQSRGGLRSLSIRPAVGEEFVVVSTATFIPPDAREMPWYQLVASPTLYGGQCIVAVVGSDERNTVGVRCRIVLQHYDGSDDLIQINGPGEALAPGAWTELTWQVPDTDGQPIAAVGIAIEPDDTRVDAPPIVYLDALGWDGEPDLSFDRPTDGGTMWVRAWVDALDQGLSVHSPEPYRLIQNAGRGMITQGTAEWRDYTVAATIRPHSAEAFGLAARVQGLRRHYLLRLGRDGALRLIKVLDGERQLAKEPVPFEFDREYRIELDVHDSRLAARVDGQPIIDVVDEDLPLLVGGIGLVCEDGRVGCHSLRVHPLA